MCDHHCRNTYGSYQCTCRDGYELAQDARTCHGKTNKHFMMSGSDLGLICIQHPVVSLLSYVAKHLQMHTYRDNINKSFVYYPLNTIQQVLFVAIWPIFILFMIY